jgi:hypothetical protein
MGCSSHGLPALSFSKRNPQGEVRSRRATAGRRAREREPGMQLRGIPGLALEPSKGFFHLSEWPVVLHPSHSSACSVTHTGCAQRSHAAPILSLAALQTSKPGMPLVRAFSIVGHYLRARHGMRVFPSNKTPTALFVHPAPSLC